MADLETQSKSIKITCSSLTLFLTLSVDLLGFVCSFTRFVIFSWFVDESNLSHSFKKREGGGGCKKSTEMNAFKKSEYKDTSVVSTTNASMFKTTIFLF